MAGGYPISHSGARGLYDGQKMFRINNDIKMEKWIELLNPLKYGKFFYISISGHMIRNDDPEVIISSIKMALKDYDKIPGEKK